ncbi:MAG: hypothetical protein PVJ67_02870 [Candidatus Pacearchaeota archaeon]|jgi:hypothetical protein
MTIKRTLTGIVLAGALALSGCGKDESNKGLIYAGNIDGNRVVYEQTSWGKGHGWTSDYRLRLKTPEGIELSFYDKDRDGTADILPDNMEKAKAQELYKTILSRINQETKK